MQKKYISGFNLIELLVVLSIVGILSALSVPTYRAYVARERQLEAKITLTKLAAALEKYFIVNNTYKNATLSALGFSTNIANNNYALAIQNASDNNYAISATPTTKNTFDSCGTLTLNALGEKSHTGQGTMNNCW